MMADGAAEGSRRRSLTLGRLLERVGDPSGRDHRALELDEITAVGSPDQPGRSIVFVLTFTDLTYCVKPQKKLWRRSYARAVAEEAAPQPPPPLKTKTLLDSVSGEAREGEILAVLGASGSGKSTLIDALANRIVKESLKGSVTLNGEPVESKLLKVISAYVMQDDLLYPMLTVEETLTFSAEFRLPRALSRSKKKVRVQALIDQLGLRSAATTIIGNEGRRGVSGGERRRVSIGIDIIHDPIILFLDEPTSGLDSTSAFMVVKVLQRIARSGSIVVMSIHQPSSRILCLLDRLLFLSRGQTVYSGTPENLPLFFSEFGKSVPENENRTEFALDLIRELEAAGGTKPLVDFHRSWQRSILRPSAGKENHSLSLKDAIAASICRGKLVAGDGGPVGAAKLRFANPLFLEMAVLAKRAATNSSRTPEIFGVRLAAILVTGFILATIFRRLDDSPKGIQERLGFFAIAMSTMFYTCADALPVFLHERYIFMRETAYNAYRRSSYVVSNAVISFPPLVILSAAFAATTFFAVGLAGGGEGFLFFFLIILASFWAGSGFVTFLSGVVSHVMIGYTIVVAILAYFLLFSGFFINRDRIPDYWIWFHYLSLVKYPYEAVLQNEFGDSRKCFVRGSQIFDGTPLGGLPAAARAEVLGAIGRSLGVGLKAESCMITGSDVLKQQGVTDLSKWSCLWITVAWGFFFRVLFYLSLLLGSKNKRR
ncbi:ABC transporter G family member 1 [Apostasia shenzhenica]|uniref:ABC transporter G family member 5 n=1 Tax=Apostasia shenzhenica TaxID=1088818 RepID=A0A2I0ASG2_9ASPA|nr:ABC transporter G family member 1 [Apostasia shenzhenica]